MRVYGRINPGAPSIIEWTADSNVVTADSDLTADGTANPASGASTTGVWVTVTTDSNGNNSWVYITALAQVLLLNLNESPFYANNGLPQQQSVTQQTAPDYYVTLTQQQFAQYFASLSIVRMAPTLANPTPTYQITALTFQGTVLQASVPIPI